MINVIDTEISDVKIIEPKLFGDARGYFFESFSQREFEEKVCKTTFVQDNESRSVAGVVRGLHYQKPPYTQSKLVRVVKGAVLDVAVDIRKGSPTFGKHVAAYLFAADSAFARSREAEAGGLAPFSQFFIPRGFAHGFIVLEDDTLFAYKCDNLYHPEADRGLRFDDPALGIEWPTLDGDIKLSEKDKHHPPLAGIVPWQPNASID